MAPMQVLAGAAVSSALGQYELRAESALSRSEANAKRPPFVVGLGSCPRTTRCSGYFGSDGVR